MNRHSRSHTDHAPISRLSNRLVAMEGKERCMRRVEALDQELSRGASAAQTLEACALEQVGLSAHRVFSVRRP